MRLVVAIVLLASALAGCQAPETVPEDVPPGVTVPPPPRTVRFDATLAVLAAAETMAPCVVDAMPPSGGAVCHEAKVEVANHARAGEVLLRDGWSAVTASGGVYAMRVVTGPAAVVGGGEGVLRLRAAVDDGSRLALVRWDDPDGPSGMQAEVPPYLDPATLAPPLRLQTAELAAGDCRNMWRCTLAIVAVDNRGRDAAFPPNDAAWFLEGMEPAHGAWGIVAEGSVPAGAQGNVTLELEHWAPTRVGLAVAGWTVPVFALPDPSTLPVRDEGAHLIAFDLMQMAQPRTNATSGAREVMLAGQATSLNGCAPFRGEVKFLLERQLFGAVDLDPLWQTVREWSVEVAPEAFVDPAGQWCAMPIVASDEDQPVSATYRLRATAVPVATGEGVVGETWFTM